MHQNAFGGRALPGPAAGAYTQRSSRPPSWIKGGGEGEGEEGGEEMKKPEDPPPNVCSALRPCMRTTIRGVYLEMWKRVYTSDVHVQKRSNISSVVV